jgi:hypothetical protein
MVKVAPPEEIHHLTLSMKRTLARIILAALVADVVGTVLILLFAVTFVGTNAENPILSYAGLAGAMLAIGGVLALPTAALGVVLGDLIAPAAGVSRTVVFAALGAGLGAFMGTPVVGGVSGVAGGIVGSYTRETDPRDSEGPTWTKLALLGALVLVCALVYFSLAAISWSTFSD